MFKLVNQVFGIFVPHSNIMSFTIIITFSSINIGIEASSLSEMWTKVSLERKYTEVDPQALSFKSGKTKCGSSCIATPWCNTWCYDQINCTLISTVVSPYYEGLSTEILTECFTKKRTDIAFGVNSYSTLLYSPERTSDNSNNGIYFHGKKSFATSVANNPWVLYDLRKPATIFEVRIQTNRDINYGPTYTTNIGIKIGDSLTTNGDFSTYELFDSMIGNCKYDEVNQFTPFRPMKGQYIAIISQANNVILAFDYIEIDGKFD